VVTPGSYYSKAGARPLFLGLKVFLMSYQTLYQRFRPRNFKDMVGQEHVTRTLKQALMRQKLGHAYLFTGPRGTGKTTSARILAKAVNCLNLKEGEPCNGCEPCLRIEAGNSLDVVEIDAASHRGIDEIRELKENLRFMPAEEKYKVYIIDEVHMLTTEAFNALLKTLEEPPANVVFIMATTEPHKVPLTIISRCQRFDFRLLGTEAIRDYLKEVTSELEVEAEEGALNLIARLSKGAMRDALSLLDRTLAYASGSKLTLEETLEVLGVVPEDALFELMDYLAEEKVGEALLLLNELVDKGKDENKIIADLMAHCQRLILIRDKKSRQYLNLPAADLKRLTEQAANLKPAFIWQTIEALKEAERQLRWTENPRLILELALLSLFSGKEIEVMAEAELKQEKKENKAVSQKEEEPKETKTQLEEEKISSFAPSPTPNIAVDLEGKWEKLLTAVKKRRIITYAFLREGSLVEINQDRMVIGYLPQNSFHKGKMEEKENREILEECIREVYGISLQPVLVKLEGEAIKPQKDQKEELKAGNKAQKAENRVDKAAAKTKKENLYEKEAQKEAQKLLSRNKNNGIVKKAQEIFGGKIIDLKEEDDYGNGWQYGQDDETGPENAKTNGPDAGGARHQDS